jgi:hypothetical protein
MMFVGNTGLFASRELLVSNYVSRLMSAYRAALKQLEPLVRKEANKKRRCWTAEVQNCVVSYSDPEGLDHSVAVQANSLFEAAAMALRAFKAHGCAPGPGCRLRVQVTPPTVTHIVIVQKVEEWLKGGARSSREALLKERLRGST